jgi:hypothetical protein
MSAIRVHLPQPRKRPNSSNESGVGLYSAIPTSSRGQAEPEENVVSDRFADTYTQKKSRTGRMSHLGSTRGASQGLLGDFARGLKQGFATKMVKQQPSRRKRFKGCSEIVEENIATSCIFSNSKANRDVLGNHENLASKSDAAPDKVFIHKVVDVSIPCSSTECSSTECSSTESSLTNRGVLPIVPSVHMVDGVIMIDEASMVFVPDAKSKDLEKSDSVYDESARVTSASYSKRTSPMKWNINDTVKFYHSLRQFGTDFAIMQHIFPGRTRRQIKNKYAKEQTAHPELISRIFNSRGRKGGDSTLSNRRHFVQKQS